VSFFTGRANPVMTEWNLGRHWRPEFQVSSELVHSTLDQLFILLLYVMGISIGALWRIAHQPMRICVFLISEYFEGFHTGKMFCRVSYVDRVELLEFSPWQSLVSVGAFLQILRVQVIFAYFL
jgi:hypothetical protein